MLPLRSCFSTLRSVIRRCNSRVVIIFSSVPPRLSKIELYKAYATGLSELLFGKWCTKSGGGGGGGGGDGVGGVGVGVGVVVLHSVL